MFILLANAGECSTSLKIQISNLDTTGKLQNHSHHHSSISQQPNSMLPTSSHDPVHPVSHPDHQSSGHATAPHDPVHPVSHPDHQSSGHATAPHDPVHPVSHLDHQSSGHPTTSSEPQQLHVPVSKSSPRFVAFDGSKAGTRLNAQPSLLIFIVAASIVAGLCLLGILYVCYRRSQRSRHYELSKRLAMDGSLSEPLCEMDRL
jgi:hypothetical protein